MKTQKATVYADVRCVLGEGPCYNAQTGELSWVDIKTGTLYVRAASGETRALQTGQYLGAAVPTRAGKHIACMTTGIYMLDGDAIEARLDVPATLQPYQRFNDAKCDPQGRLFAGTMPLFMKYVSQGGKLYRYAGGASEELPVSVVVPNGMAWTADGRTMYLVDTAFGTVDAFDYNQENGEMSNRRRAIQVENGSPDGMTIDAEDRLWIAVWGAGEVRRYDAETGAVLETITVDAKFTSSCCFGGEDLQTLFITTSAEGDAGHPLAGCVFSCHTDTRGVSTSLFNDL